MTTSSASRDATILSAGIVLGAASALAANRIIASRRRKRPTTTGSSKSTTDENTVEHNATSLTCPTPTELPLFAQRLASDPKLHRITLREWEDMEWRAKSGWKGRDYVHNPNGSAVRVLAYYYDDSQPPPSDDIAQNDGSNQSGDSNQQSNSNPNNTMTGVVWFGPHAESHRGLCHGGAMSALMDDFCGHVAFVTSTQPWSGATVNLNVSLKKPVPVGSVLRIKGRVRKRERRKVYVEAVLDDGVDEEEGDGQPTVYAALEGLSIDNVRMSVHEDEIAKRTWEVHTCQEGRKHRRDSGWNLGAVVPSSSELLGEE